VRKDFYKGNLVRVEGIPYEEDEVEHDADNAEDNTVDIE